ncbi:ATP-binding protein [Actinomadura fibrosa]|uniref:ATP-binding protein n=1 Tax=Actinomadura fibrosa TaxID=111802 RepID=UPI00104151E8|nr:ATP-binding protein [Actinomadura fibrosa]
MLYGREPEQALIDRMLADGRAGLSGSLVLSGDVGTGKSALLAFAADRASGARVVRVAGVEAEARLPFAGLHLLLRSVADRVEALPASQREVLRDPLGTGVSGPEECVRVGLAVLALLSGTGCDGRLAVLIDDAQWLDGPSAEALLFAARRLEAGGTTMIFAGRGGDGFPAQGLPSRVLGPLDAEAAAGLLDERHPDLSPWVRERLLREAAGNPAALVALPAALTDRERTGGLFPPAGPVGLDRFPAEWRGAFDAQVAGLPAATRALLLLAALDDRGELGVLVCAGRRLGASVGDLEAAEQGGLIEVRDRRLVFRNPLLRAAIAAASSLPRRSAAHEALAAAYGDERDAERRAWHLAAGAVEADEELAAALARTAGRARASA